MNQNAWAFIGQIRLNPLNSSENAPKSSGIMNTEYANESFIETRN